MISTRIIHEIQILHAPVRDPDSTCTKGLTNEYDISECYVLHEIILMQLSIILYIFHAQACTCTCTCHKISQWLMQFTTPIIIIIGKHTRQLLYSLSFAIFHAQACIYSVQCTYTMYIHVHVLVLYMYVCTVITPFLPRGAQFLCHLITLGKSFFSLMRNVVT